MSVEQQVAGEELVTETEPRAKTTSKFMNGTSAGPACRECNKCVYQMEKIVADQHVYHKTCFRCTHCNRVLSLGNYATGGAGKPYCKPHFISLFKVKGNYEEGFSMTSELMVSRDEVDKSSAFNLGDKSAENADCGGSGYEEQRFITMASAKSVFERPVTSDTSPKLTKKASKWDKPKPVPPPAVNRDSENIEQSTDSELPPPAYTKNMLAKFQSLQQSDGQLMKDSQTKPVKLWEDDLSADKSSPPHDAVTHTTAAEGVGETGVAGDDDGQVSSCAVAETESHKVERCGDDTRASVEENTDSESEGSEEECLINFDDDGVDVNEPAAEDDDDVDVTDSAADKDTAECDEVSTSDLAADEDVVECDEVNTSDLAVDGDAAECHVQKHEDDTSSNSQHPTDADGVASEDDTNIHDCSTGQV